jgi:hypothetical protein
MQTMEQSLTDLVQANLISVSEAVGRTSRSEALMSALERAGIPVSLMSNDAKPAAAPTTMGAGLRVAGS